MDITALLESKLFIALISGAGALIVRGIAKRRALFTYSAFHQKIIVLDNKNIGEIKVTLGEDEIPNPYISEIILKNESTNDFENIIFRSYSNNETTLLSEQTVIINKPEILTYTEDFKKQIDPKLSSQETALEILHHQREYIIPVLNRGEAIKLTYLSSVKQNSTPSIYVSLKKKGTKLKFISSMQPHILGVPLIQAQIFGTITAISLTIALLWTTNNPNIIAATTLTLGFFAGLLGTATIKIYTKIKDIFFG